MSSSEGSSRFCQIFDEDLDILRSSLVPENTRNKEKWCIKLFRHWPCYFDHELVGDLKNKDLKEFGPLDLDICLQYFIPSVRKVS